MVSPIKHYERHGQTCCNSDFRFLGQQICPVHFNRDFPGSDSEEDDEGQLAGEWIKVHGFG